MSDDFEKKLEENNKSPSIHYALILDESGSMQNLREDTIEHFNEHVQSIRKTANEEDVDLYVTLITFSDGVKRIFKTESVDNLEELTKEDYSPSGLTAMNDGIITGIKSIDPHVNNGQGIVTVFTDGGENNSSQYPDKKGGREEVREMVDDREDEGWQFTFVGVGDEIFAQSASYGFDPDSTVSWDSSKSGTRKAYKRITMSTQNYVSSVSQQFDVEDE